MNWSVRDEIHTQCFTDITPSGVFQVFPVGHSEHSLQD